MKIKQTKEDVDSFLENAKKWQSEMKLLRTIVLKTPLEEDFKWKQPCYTINNKNLVIISGFKDYCLLGFFNGSLLKDPYKKLHKPGENSQAMRQFRFVDTATIKSTEKEILEYINESIELEKNGKKVHFEKNILDDYSPELNTIFAKDANFKKAFLSLTPGRQRAYNLFFNAAKQAKTRIDRIEKYKPKIIEGKGMND